MSTKQFYMLAAVVASAALSAGCPASGEDVRPPADQLFFPSGLTISPDESVLFVANGNSELRYDSGTVGVVDLDKVDELIATWIGGVVPPDRGSCTDCCEIDPTIPSIISCNENSAVNPDAVVRIGNFATDLKVQTLEDGNLRLFVAVRGEPSITYVDYDTDGGTLSCGGSGTMPRCDQDHRMTQMRDDVELPTLTDEPFNLFVDSVNGYAMVSHLTIAAVTLIDAPPNGAPPVLADVVSGLFARSPTTGARGAVGIAGRRPGQPGDTVYVTSRAESRIHTLSVFRREGELPMLVPGDFFFLNRILPSDDSRGIVFGADGDRAYIINRDPSMLQIIDTSLAADGKPKNELDGAIEICRGAAVLTLADVGEGEHLFVSCFSLGQVWVMDPVALQVIAIIDVGRGPHSLVASPTRKRLYVANFLEDTIAVLDLTPGAATEHRMVLRLGRTRQSGGK